MAFIENCKKKVKIIFINVLNINISGTELNKREFNNNTNIIILAYAR